MDFELLTQALLNIPYQLDSDYVDSGVCDELIGFRFNINRITDFQRKLDEAVKQVIALQLKVTEFD